VVNSLKSGRGVTLLISSVTAGSLSSGLLISSSARRGMARISARARRMEPSPKRSSKAPVFLS
jgi:hypothetical protein